MHTKKDKVLESMGSDLTMTLTDSVTLSKLVNLLRLLYLQKGGNNSSSFIGVF